ncbi:MAG: hypothetical protein AAF901_14695, partial [Bacteroidota bacterium]
MIKSKLLSLIQGIQQEEHKKLRDFILSPYFNKRPELVKLYDYIIQLYPDYDEAHLERKRVYEHIFPSDNYN